MMPSCAISATARRPRQTQSGQLVHRFYRTCLHVDARAEAHRPHTAQTRSPMLASQHAQAAAPRSFSGLSARSRVAPSPVTLSGPSAHRGVRSLRLNVSANDGGWRVMRQKLTVRLQKIVCVKVHPPAHPAALCLPDALRCSRSAGRTLDWLQSRLLSRVANRRHGYLLLTNICTLAVSRRRRSEACQMTPWRLRVLTVLSSWCDMQILTPISSS